MNTENKTNCLGIIYRAYNKKTGKSYIGQTISTIKSRMYCHYHSSKSKKTHFSMALNKYEREDWEWIVLEDNIPECEIDDREIFYISKYDSYNNGYNMTLGGQKTHKKTNNIISLYHPKYGIVTGTAKELGKYEGLIPESARSLGRLKINSYNGWVNSIDKNTYYEKINQRKSSFYHLYSKKHGIVIGTKRFLCKKYGICSTFLSLMKIGKVKKYKEWVYIRDRYNYDEIIVNMKGKNCKFFALYNPEFGVVTATTEQFLKEYDIPIDYPKGIVSNKYPYYKGWVSVENMNRQYEVVNAYRIKRMASYCKENLLITGTDDEVCVHLNCDRKRVNDLKNGKIKDINGWVFKCRYGDLDFNYKNGLLII